MTPSEARQLIVNKFPALMKTTIIKVGYHKNLLTISGSPMAVQAVDKFVMQGLIPTECKAHEKSQEQGNAIYSYKF